MCIDIIKKIKIAMTLLSMGLMLSSKMLYAEGKFSHNSSQHTTAQLAIIIDDIGAKASDEAAFNLPKNVTFSILPHTEFSTEFSYRSAHQNREVMLHMPMESLRDVNLGDGPLLANMYPKEIRNALANALQTVPHAVGVNNHMGSKLTQMTLQLTSVMQVLADSNLFFIDSRTTRFTKASTIAEQVGVKVASRHVFLDHEQDIMFLEQQFNQAIRRAEKHQKAILIAHPYPITLKFLHKRLQNLPEHIELIRVSEYLQEKNKFRINPRLVMRSLEENTDTSLVSARQYQQVGSAIDNTDANLDDSASLAAPDQ